MSIDDGFKKLLAGVKLADEGRDEIMRGLEEAWEGRTDLDHTMQDLRETVATLQAMILEQGRALTDARQELGELRKRLEP